MSRNHDAFDVHVIGNLIAEPTIIDGDDGDKICYCRVATNPRGRKVDPRTREKVPDDVRHRRRSFLDLKICGSDQALKFYSNMHSGDRIELEGEAGTKQVQKMVWSESDKKYMPLEVFMDGDKEDSCQKVMEDRIVVWVQDFVKVNMPKDKTSMPEVQYV